MQRGATEQNGSNFRFATITKRGFVERVEEGTEGAKARKLEAGDNIGKVVHELIHANIVGRIEEVKKIENEQFGDSYNIKIDTSVNGNGEKFVLSTKLNSNYTRNLLKQLVKVNPEADTKLSHRYEEPKDGYKYGQINLGVLQAGEDGKNHFVGYAYTNANPNGLPAAGEYVDGEGKKRKSFLEQNEFLENAIAAIQFSAGGGAIREEATEFESVEDEDDLPF